MSEIRVLIVEDDPIIAEDIKEMLTNVDYTVLGIAYSKMEAIRLIDLYAPDLALLDINLNGSYEGFDIATHINNTRKIPFLYLTSYSGKEFVNQAKITSPMGYIIKPFNEAELYSSIEVALYNFSRFLLPASLNKDQINSILFTPLTDREFEILTGLYEGVTNQQLANRNFVSVNTVKTHLKNIYEKLETHTRSETISKLTEMLH
ncbi:response regulator transcription factor [Dyadobacter pollutisoli]|jgi:DNA-binding NarL/FixJ family response regulator|uniref:Response regulator transcription factor n=1 Tax=Dyadobacter pollutisoli TaxID=2910158 RepID=A0A9E8SLF0_9BACT|nr:response regulator transcription factor [Dyadobacter pollutisoli]WAC12978.1 response regulator transcription factor [Dyadobacter pollutisoli]